MTALERAVTAGFDSNLPGHHNWNILHRLSKSTLVPSVFAEQLLNRRHRPREDIRDFALSLEDLTMKGFGDVDHLTRANILVKCFVAEVCDADLKLFETSSPKRAEILMVKQMSAIF